MEIEKGISHQEEEITDDGYSESSLDKAVDLQAGQWSSIPNFNAVQKKDKKKRIANSR